MPYIFKMDQNWLFIITAVASFTIGSFPTAYVLVRRHHNKDLRQEGSGNIGTLNAFEVTRSRGIGVAVLLIDLAKGALPLGLLLMLGIDDFAVGALALLAVVAGHNYSPWIGWKGGRGLAPAAGASLLLSFPFPLLWMLLWGAGYWRARNVHFGNLAATLLAPFVVLLVPDVFAAFSVFRVTSPIPVIAVFFLLSVLVILRHLGPLRELLASYRKH